MGNLFDRLMKGKVVIVGIGNPLRGDDGFGPALIQRLQGKVSSICVDAGTVPENYAGRMVKENPDTVLLVDAVDLGLEPGHYRILETEDISKCGLTTHNMSLRMLIEFLEAETHADLLMLGIQPQNLSLGEAMSDCLLETLDEIETLIQEAGPCTRPISSSPSSREYRPTLKGKEPGPY